MSHRAVSVENSTRLTYHGEVSPNAIPQSASGSIRALLLAWGWV